MKHTSIDKLSPMEMQRLPPAEAYKLMWSHGASVGQIAELMGVTRNQASGKIAALRHAGHDLPHRLSPTRKRGSAIANGILPPQTPRPPKPSEDPSSFLPSLVLFELPTLEPQPPIPRSSPTCLYILTTLGRGRVLQCAEPTEGHRAYCKEHRGLCIERSRSASASIVEHLP